MDRILFQRARSGFRTVLGEIVRSVQAALAGAGFDPGPVDGAYGSATETALGAWQAPNQISPTGKVDVRSWERLTGKPVPPLFERALQLTGAFEGHGFRKAAGNFDGAGLTWGIIGFTLKHGELQKILRGLHEGSPQVLSNAFGPLENELLTLLEKDLPAQLAWADGISLGAGKHGIRPEWSAAFERLGGAPEAQDLQCARAREVYWRRAVADARDLGLATELGLALCFDIAVQNGGIDRQEKERIRSRWQAEPASSESARRLVVADVVAENSNPRWIEDVRTRKRTIATGQGDIHGARYEVANWGLDELEVVPDQL